MDYKAGTTTLENNLVVSQKIGIPEDPGNHRIPRKKESRSFFLDESPTDCVDKMQIYFAFKMRHLKAHIKQHVVTSLE